MAKLLAVIACIPLPGTEGGPCKVDCEHAACKVSHGLRNGVCAGCGEGIEDRPYAAYRDHGLFHSACLSRLFKERG